MPIDFEKLARSSIKRIDVSTAYGPPISIENPFEKGPPNPYLQRLKPQVDITFVTGDSTQIAPYGSPGPSKWPQIELGVKLGGVAIAAALVYWIAYKLR